MHEVKLVLLSGGLDSAYLLWDMAAHSDAMIHVHHVIIKTRREPRWQPELNASRNIVAYIRQNYRHFDYSESLFEFRHDNFIPYDIEVCLYIAANVAKNLKGRISVVSGRVKDDVPDASVMMRIEENHRMWAFATRGYKNIDPVVGNPLADKYKAQLIQELPAQLFKIAWYCRHPVGPTGERTGNSNSIWRPCNKCKSCLMILKAMKISDRTGRV